MKGWNLAGEPVDLLPWQEEDVKALLGWDDGHRGVVLRSRDHGAGKSVVLYTVGRYARARGRAGRCETIRYGGGMTGRSRA